KLVVVTDEQVVDGAAETRLVRVVDAADAARPHVVGVCPEPQRRHTELRFGPHNLHENRPGSYRSERFVFVTYFSAGLVVYDVAERYRVGRSSVREALRMLESRGLIESRGSGTFVVAAWRNPFQEPLSLVVAGEDVDRAQLFEVRRMLEAEAAALAAKRRTVD